MREIKFRARDKFSGKMFEPEFITSDGKPVIRIDKKDAIKYDLPLMQYTGTRDNTKWEELTELEREEWTLSGNMPSKWSGKKIYEGDIVIGMGETSEPPSDVTGTIVFEEDHGGYFIDVDENISIPLGMVDRVCVVGNIYENPEPKQITKE